MDPLADIISLLNPHAAMSKPISGRGTWGVRYDPYGAPGFALLLAGHCWLTLEGSEPVRLERGDFILLPSTPAFSLASAPGLDCVAAEPTDVAVRHGEPDGEAEVEMIGGAFRIDPVNAPLLLALLPNLIHVRANQAGSLAHLVGLTIDECVADRPGRELIVRRLLEVILIECLRADDICGGTLPAGLLTGLQDPALARALRALHDEVRRGWTVAELAGIAGMSRSAFAARFSEKLGCAPMEYLARWRMAIARGALARGEKSLGQLADELGYESASAFNTAFRRRIGCPPGAFARARGDAVRTQLADGAATIKTGYSRPG